MKDIKTFLSKPYIHENLDLDLIPEEAMIDEPTEYEGEPEYTRYLYFGDCINTVDVDEMWDATQMQHWLNDCEIVNINYVVDKLKDGDRKIPKKLLNSIKKHKDDLSEICCGIDDSQEMMFIYVSEYDTHYFFDCK